MIVTPRRGNKFLRSEEGQVAVEYAALLALIVAATFATLSAFGGGVRGLYVAISAAVGIG